MPQEFAAIPLHTLPLLGDPVAHARLRVEPEDFEVCEIPMVTPCGAGEHSWLRVRKRNSNTPWVAAQLAAFAGVAGGAVSYAGMKDRRAVTEQWFSVHLPGSVDPDWATLAQADFQVLEWQRHQRKLKTGTLRGNRFRLRLRDVDADQAQIETRLQALASHGMPNYFGPQRFGHAGNNLAEAARMFAARKRRVARARRSIYLSAVRAALFNRVLAARIENGLWATVLPGDALQLEGKSACFTSAEGDDSQYRLDQRDVHLTGPLCGEGTPLSSGAALAFEAAVLQPWQRWIDGLAGARVAAARRALRVLPQDLAWEVRDNDWLIEFALPAGSFATSLLAEVFSLDEVHDGTG